MNGVTGAITFSQPDAGGNVMMELNLHGLKSRAKNYHVHVKPLDKAAASVCSEASVGGHFNSAGVDYSTTPCNSSSIASCEADVT